MDLGQRISRARKRQNMTQAYVAQQLGVEQKVVDGWEGALAQPAPAQLERLRELLHQSLTDQPVTKETAIRAGGARLWTWGRHK